MSVSSAIAFASCFAFGRFGRYRPGLGEARARH